MYKVEERYRRQAKGKVQRELEEDLLSFGKTLWLKHYMKSQSNCRKYFRSFMNLINRMKKQGLDVVFYPGVNGNYRTGFFYIRKGVIA